jgi:uncharacterized protein YbjT (DUF2867 family)
MISTLGCASTSGPAPVLPTMAHVFVSGSTGFVGTATIRRLLQRQHTVAALTRPSSAGKVPQGARAVVGDPLETSTFRPHVAPADTFLHLTGVTKPAPWKEKQFRAIDLGSLRQSVDAAKDAGVRHFVYVSVAQPAPVMKAYIRVRQECESYIRDSGIPATILRPWYVLGPGRQWPVLLRPFYWMMEAAGSDAATRLGLLRQEQMTEALLWSIEHPGSRILDVSDIRKVAGGVG